MVSLTCDRLLQASVQINDDANIATQTSSEDQTAYEKAIFGLEGVQACEWSIQWQEQHDQVCRERDGAVNEVQSCVNWYAEDAAPAQEIFTA